MARSCHMAVIGAGVSGLVAARELLIEGHRVVIFEQSDRVGGTWVYDPRVESDPLGLDPSREIVHSSLYSSLRTNVPWQLMGFLDYPFRRTRSEGGDGRAFPGHEEVLAFIEDFAAEHGLLQLVRFRSQVIGVRANGRTRRDEWVVEWRTRESDSESEAEVFEGVVICSGHYTKPRIADIAGLQKWKGRQVHSHNYRTPEPFQDQIVLLIGNGPSAFDISREISKVAKQVHLTSRSKDVKAQKLEGHHNIWQHLTIESVNEDGTILFRDGSSILPDIILHCTGYNYHYPFLETNGVISIDDNRVGPLYKHVFPPQFAPWLSFVGIPMKVIPFLTVELQSKWIAKVLSNKVVLPAEEEMMASIEEVYQNIEESGMPKYCTHILYPHEVEYRNWLVAQIGLPPLEEWIENMYRACMKSLLNNLDTYRDGWNDEYWSQQLESSIQSRIHHCEARNEVGDQLSRK